jgi:hypothetical protein
MPLEVSDKIANLNDHLANAARLLQKSPQRRKIFETIYRGKKRAKSKADIARMTGFTEMRVLQEGAKLAANQLVESVKQNGATAYKKIDFYSHYKAKILQLATNKRRLNSLPTKTAPRGSRATGLTIKYPAKTFDVVALTIDDVDGFSAVKSCLSSGPNQPIREDRVKQGIKRILGEAGTFKDWGGEKNDLYTTRIRLQGKRHSCAFAFKGQGLKGVLKPNRMGKNGDQISRLFQAEANVFILQYWGQVDQSVYEMMKSLAVAKSAINRERIYYCIIDGQDTNRLLRSYPRQFSKR